MQKKDVILLFNHGPIHLELVARGVESEEEALASLPERFRMGHLATAAWEQDGRLYIDVGVVGASVNIALRLDRPDQLRGDEVVVYDESSHEE
jgi:hypothetical protein